MQVRFARRLLSVMMLAAARAQRRRYLSAKAQLDEPLPLWPVHALLMQIDVLQLLVPLVGEGNVVAVVGLLSGQLTFPAGRCNTRAPPSSAARCSRTHVLGAVAIVQVSPVHRK